MSVVKRQKLQGSRLGSSSRVGDVRTRVHLGWLKDPAQRSPRGGASFAELAYDLAWFRGLATTWSVFDECVSYNNFGPVRWVETSDLGPVQLRNLERSVRSEPPPREDAKRCPKCELSVQEAPSQSRRARLRNHPKNFESLDGHEKKRKMVLILFFAHPHSRTLSFEGWIQRNSPSLPLQISSLPDPFTGSPLMLAGKSR
ncbi:hypothetical protein BHE74_00027979 [Ensete ventricosum]|nr:hypothetical protein BHE74_00027979 [Ensete ventricosum]